MNGKLLRKKIEECNISLRELARKLNISEQNLQNKLNAQDIKVSFLMDVSEKLNKHISFFFDESFPGFVSEKEDLYEGNSSTDKFYSKKEFTRKLESLEHQLEEKERIIKSLELTLEAQRDLIEFQKETIQSMKENN